MRVFQVRASSPPDRLPLCQISRPPLLNYSPWRKIAYSISQSFNHSLTRPAYLMPRFGTSNGTGRQRGPKRKLRAGYRAPSLKRTSYPKRIHYNAHYMLRCLFIVACGIARFLGAMRVFDVRASSSPLGYLCAKFVSVAASVAELAHREKSRTPSLSQFSSCVTSVRDVKFFVVESGIARFNEALR